MSENKVLYTILSVLALIVVVVGIVFAWQSYNNESNMKSVPMDAFFMSK